MNPFRNFQPLRAVATLFTDYRLSRLALEKAVEEAVSTAYPAYGCAKIDLQLSLILRMKDGVLKRSAYGRAWIVKESEIAERPGLGLWIIIRVVEVAKTQYGWSFGAALFIAPQIIQVIPSAITPDQEAIHYPCHPFISAAEIFGA